MNSLVPFLSLPEDQNWKDLLGPCPGNPVDVELPEQLERGTSSPSWIGPRLESFFQAWSKGNTTVPKRRHRTPAAGDCVTSVFPRAIEIPLLLDGVARDFDKIVADVAAAHNHNVVVDVEDIY